MKRSPTILIIAPYGFNDRMTNFIEFVTGRLLVKEGWRVLALARSEQGEKNRSMVSGIEVHRYPTSRAGIRTAFSLIFSMRPDVVHVHNLRNNRAGIFAAMLAKSLGIPLAFTEYGLLHDHYLVTDREDPFNGSRTYDYVVSTILQLLKRSWHNPGNIRTYVMSYFFHWPLTHADSVVFVSKHNLEVAHEIGIKHYQYLPQLSDMVRFEKKIDLKDSELSSHEVDVRRFLKDTPEGTYALFIGQIKLRKGWDILLHAIPEIPKSVIEKFIIVTSSSPKEQEEYLEVVERLGVKDRILLLGQIFNSELLLDVYRKSTIVVVPSRYEGFGLVPLEAFEMKKPVIASRVEALTDFLEHEKNAFLVTPKDPQDLARGMREVASNPTLQAKLIQGGLDTLTQMRSDEYKNRWLAFYNALLSPTSREK